MNTHDIETTLRSYLTSDGYIAADDIPAICAAIKADRQTQATIYANQYLSLTDAMGYESDSGLSPEEWAANLLADRQANNPESLTPAEAVFAFAAWLTSREQSVTFGAVHGAAIAADLASEFTKSQGLQKFREDFHTRLSQYPEELPEADRLSSSGRSALRSRKCE